jgi:hypothetical protein
LVSHGQTLRQPFGDAHRLPPIQRVALDPRREGFPLEILHDGEERSLLVGDVVDGADVWMGECRDRLALALKPGDGVGIAGERRRQHLDRHVPFQTRVPRPVDLAHPTGA